MQHRDSRAFAVERYNDILESLNNALLSESDRKTIKEPRDWKTIQAEIQRRRQDLDISAPCKRLLDSFQPLTRTLNDLTQFLQHAVHPYKPQMEPLWGLLYLNIKVLHCRIMFSTS
jgi:hypothetical protein